MERRGRRTKDIENWKILKQGGGELRQQRVKAKNIKGGEKSKKVQNRLWEEEKGLIEKSGKVALTMTEI